MGKKILMLVGDYAEDYEDHGTVSGITDDRPSG